MMPATPIAFDPEVVQGRLSAQRRRMFGALTGLVVPVVGGGILYLVLRSRGQERGLLDVLVGFLVFSAAISLVLFVVHLVWWLRMRRQVVEPGLALQLSPLGIEVEGARIAWPEVTAIRTGWSRVGDGHTLIIERAGQPAVEMPLDSLTILPGSLDSAIRAHSGGRHVLDLSAYGA
ncbi:hypothetical protein [Mariniluteicoccus flavus]